MTLRLRFIALVSCAPVAAFGCAGGGPMPPTAPAPTPTVTAVVVTGFGAPLVGDSAQLTASATMSDGTSQVVTTQATWESSNPAIATVSSGGLATFLALGDADIKATYKSVSGTGHVTVATKPSPKYTLAGTVTDATNGSPLANVNARILDGLDAGRVAVTDATGKYTMTNLNPGSFLVQYTRSDYETRSVPVSLNGDTAVEVRITAVAASVTRFYGTYNTTLSIHQQTCPESFTVGPTGTFRIEGNTSGSSMTVTIVERGTTRTYNGSIRGDGSFSGNGGGVIAGFSPPKNKHEYTGSISGTSNGTRLDATEFVNFTIPCPGAKMQIGYSGSK